MTLSGCISPVSSSWTMQTCFRSWQRPRSILKCNFPVGVLSWTRRKCVALAGARVVVGRAECLWVFLCLSLHVCLYASLHESRHILLHVSHTSYVLVFQCKKHQSCSCCLFLSFFLSVCLSVFLSFFLSVFLSSCLSVFLSFCLSVFLSFCLSVFLSFCLSFCLSVCLSVFFRGLCRYRLNLSCKLCLLPSEFRHIWLMGTM